MCPQSVNVGISPGPVVEAGRSSNVSVTPRSVRCFEDRNRVGEHPNAGRLHRAGLALSSAIGPIQSRGMAESRRDVERQGSVVVMASSHPRVCVTEPGSSTWHNTEDYCADWRWDQSCRCPILVNGSLCAGDNSWEKHCQRHCCQNCSQDKVLVK